jgi:hypothetical protein
MARPSASNINHALFERASKLFTNILDEILDPPMPVSSSADANEAHKAHDAHAGMGMRTVGEDWNSSWAADGMDFLDTLNFEVVLDQWVF